MESQEELPLTANGVPHRHNPLTEIDNDDSLSLLKVTPQLMHFDSFQIGCLNFPPHTGHSEEVPSGFTYNVLFLDL